MSLLPTPALRSAAAACALAALATGCGGGSVRLDLTSDDAADNVLALATTPAPNLASVRSVRVTVDEVWLHVADGDEAPLLQPEAADVPEGSSGWRRVSDVPHAVDLMALRSGAALALGEWEVPEGALTQVRLRLAAVPEGEEGRVAGAVLDDAGTGCDLLLPRSAWQPGLAVSGPLARLPLDGEEARRALLSLKLNDSRREELEGGGCAYHLNPVLKVLRFERDR